jgi:Zn-dependent protease/CBS domain-containing protein
MNRGFGIGRLFGINISVDWSWLVIFSLVTWSLGSGLGQVHGEWSRGTVWGVAVAAALLFFTSVLAHELAHSLFARSRGIPVRVITLFLFGGVSNIEKQPDSPREEFLMAILGPVTSLVIGALLLTVTGLVAGPLRGGATDPMQAARSLGPITTILYWLGSINIILGIFNLVPGFPLDGGRVLRSILWALIGDLRRATRIASWAGQGIGLLFIFSGISMAFGARLPFFGTGIGGLWLAFIGWFLHSAATQSYRQVVVRDILGGVPAGQIALSDPPTVPADARVSQLVHDYIMRTDDHAFGVVEGGSFVGLVTLGDVRGLSRNAWDDAQVREIMTPAAELLTVEPDEDAAEALTKLAQRDVRQLPVVREGHLVGLLRRRDIVRWLHLHAEFGLGTRLGASESEAHSRGH